MDWTTIRELCKAAGLGGELRKFERSLPKTLGTELMNKTGKWLQYQTDATFRAQVDLLCILLCNVLTQAHVPDADLRAAFDDEVRKVME